MTCEDIIQGEIIESYLHDRLSDEERDSFEEHYFECRRCFGLLQTYQDVQAELVRTRESGMPRASRWSSVREWAWVPAAAGVMLAVGLALLQRPFTEIRRPETRDVPPSAPATPAVPSLPPSQPKPALDVLARVEPPPYEPVRLRGAADEATARFQEAMTHYLRRDYPAGIIGLRQAAELDPEAPHILFFLGVSQLLDDKPETAMDDLRRTIALGDSAYLEEAHFFLAKTLLQQGSIEDAYRELESTIQLGGERETEARKLLLQLESFREPK